MAKHKAKDLKVKTNDELKQQLTCLEKSNLIFDFKLLMVRMKIQLDLSILEER